MKCLLVDDEPGIREGLAALLRRKGHEVRTAADCAAAAHCLATDTFDVVITDWHLPDGLASTFAGGAPCPVVAVSGHPEEVEASAPIVTVLTKPVTPARLQEALLAVVPAAAPARPASLELDQLPLDVRSVLQTALARLPADAVAELRDDGTFVTLEVRLADARPLALGLADGDLRVGLVDGRRRLELRLCRDGRPDVNLPVVPFGTPWPEHREFAVDFGGRQPEGLDLGSLAARLGEATATGRRVHLLNVPAVIRDGLDHGNGHDMPMRAPVGPRLRPELADLWSQS